MARSNHPQLPAHVTVVGMGAAGWSSLTTQLQNQIATAEVVVGSERLLRQVPHQVGQRQLPWPRPMRANLSNFLADLSGSEIVALASGDPLVSGIGSTLLGMMEPEKVTIIPAVSSVALARAVLGWSAESATVLSLVGRDPALLARELAPGHRLLVLSSDESTPAAVAQLLDDRGFGRSVLHVLGDLGTAHQSHRTVQADEWTGPAPRLHILGIELSGPVRGGWAGGLPDDLFEHDGQLTKRDPRASALARLAPTPGAYLWDVGAGAGSISIEWLRTNPRCRATAVEENPDRAARIKRNATSLGVPQLQIELGSAPEALDGLNAPDAIFVGGGATVPGVLDRCLSALRPGGRLVVHGVTLQTEQLLAELYSQHGGELTRLAVQSAAPIGSFTGWTPARTVTQWCLVR